MNVIDILMIIIITIGLCMGIVSFIEYKENKNYCESMGYKIDSHNAQTFKCIEINGNQLIYHSFIKLDSKYYEVKKDA